jgi:hypothetical protein
MSGRKWGQNANEMNGVGWRGGLRIKWGKRRKNTTQGGKERKRKKEEESGMANQSEARPPATTHDQRLKRLRPLDQIEPIGVVDQLPLRRLLTSTVFQLFSDEKFNQNN